MNPVTLADLGQFLQSMFNAYDAYYFLAFVIMATSSLLVLTRRLLVGTKQ